MTSTIADHVKEILRGIGENPDREGLLKTPARVQQALTDITSGYGEDPVKILNKAMFTVDTDEMVIVKDIEIYSLCEHHMLPFFGKAHVAYLPAGRVVGLAFDGNIEQLPNEYLFRDEAGRTVGVHSAGILEALRSVYKAEALLRELLGNGTRGGDQ